MESKNLKKLPIKQDIETKKTLKVFTSTKLMKKTNVNTRKT